MDLGVWARWIGQEVCARWGDAFAQAFAEGERLEGGVAGSVVEGAEEAEENATATIEGEAARGEGRSRDSTIESSEACA